jgi:hypothetical protein
MTKANLVESTGCKKGDSLVGAYDVNRDMKIRVFCAQSKGGGKIEGDFDLLDAGTGTYAAAMAEFVGRHFDSAKELIGLVRKKLGTKEYTYALNKEMLLVEPPTGRIKIDKLCPSCREIVRKERAERAQRFRDRQKALGRTPAPPTKGRPASQRPRVHADRLPPDTVAGQLLYGDIAVPVLQRNWEGQSMPYVWVINLKPGETWHDAKVTTKKLPTECYVQTLKGFIPPGALAARELIAEGASFAVWTDCWQHRAVFMLPPPEFRCVELTGELWDMLQKIKAATHNRWSGLPDAIAVFPEGRIVMREMKFIGRDKRTHRLGRDKLSDKQHAFARAAETLFPRRIEFAVIEWGHVPRNQT